MAEISGPNPARWCVDPGNPAQWRYWDGAQWTDHVAPRDASPDVGESREAKSLAAKDRKAAKREHVARLKRAASRQHVVEELPAEVEVIVVGSGYHDGLKGLYAGTVHGVTVRPEPTNPHDRNAIIVEVRGKKAGYLSAYQAKRYRPLIARKSAVRARYSRTDVGPTLWVMLPKPPKR